MVKEHRTGIRPREHPITLYIESLTPSEENGSSHGLPAIVPKLRRHAVRSMDVIDRIETAVDAFDQRVFCG
jgi:hypothetical protein